MFYRNNNDDNVDFLLFVEHRDRELEITSNIASLLESMNYSVAVASTLYHQIPSLLKIKPKVLVTPSTCFGKGSVAELFYSVYGDSITFVNLNYEQFISSWKGSYKTSSHSYSKQKQIHFVWGEYFKNQLENNGVEGSNIIITGRPSLSLVKNRYNNMSTSELEKYNPIFRGKKLCFIALTDGLAFVDQKKIDFIISNGADRHGLESHVDYVKKNIKCMLIELSSVSKLRKDVVFVIRPHPSIPESAYIDLFDKYNLQLENNIIISKDKNAYWWLALSDYYITNYSTLCLEAKVLGKTAFTYEKIHRDKVEKYWYTETAIPISSIESILGNEGSVELSSSQDLSYKERSNMYIDFDKDGLESTVKELTRLYSDKLPSRIRSPYSVLFVNKKRMLGSIVRNIYARMGFAPFGKVSKGVIKDFFDHQDVESMIKEIK